MHLKSSGSSFMIKTFDPDDPPLYQLSPVRETILLEMASKGGHTSRSVWRSITP